LPVGVDLLHQPACRPPQLGRIARHERPGADLLVQPSIHLTRVFDSEVVGDVDDLAGGIGLVLTVGHRHQRARQPLHQRHRPLDTPLRRLPRQLQLQRGLLGHIPRPVPQLMQPCQRAGLQRIRPRPHPGCRTQRANHLVGIQLRDLVVQPQPLMLTHRRRWIRRRHGMGRERGHAQHCLERQFDRQA